MISLPHGYWTWDVAPEIFRLGSFALRWYSLLFLAAFLIGLRIMRSVFRREGKPEVDLETLLLTMLAGTLIGARLGHCFFYEPARYLAHPIEILMIWKGGLASHGGLIGILVAIKIYCRKRADQPYLWMLDRIAWPTALAGSLIRLGNLFNSEIVGAPTDVPWAVLLTRIPNAEPTHPVQLYESASYFAIFLFLGAIYRRYGAAAPRGLMLGAFLVLVFSARFVLEFFKSPQAHYELGVPLSVGQALSIPTVLVGAILLIGALRNGPAPTP